MTGHEAITLPRKRPRPWHLIVAAIAFTLLALMVVLLLLRSNGRARWQSYLAAEQAAGRPLTVEDFVALAPPVDLSVQASWDAWSTTYSASTRAPAPNLFDALKPHRRSWDAWVTGYGPLPSALVELFAHEEKALAPALVPLRTGRLVLSTFGWAKEDFVPGRSGGFPRRSPNYFTVWSLSEWLRHHAVLGDDPTQDLADLDALHNALAKPATLRDTDITIAHGYIRDRAYLELALQDRLPIAMRDRWLAEPCHYVEMIGDALISERIQLVTSYANRLTLTCTDFIDANVRSSGGWQWSHANNIVIAPWLWVVGWDDLPPIADFLHHAATRLRGEHHEPVLDARTFEAHLHGISPYLAIPYRLNFAGEAVRKDAFHRQIRLAVRVLTLMRSGGLPADQADLLTRLGDPNALHAGVDRRTLLYERPAPDRFRLAIDPASPIPDFDNAMQMFKPPSAAGSPARIEPLTTDSLAEEQLVEIQVPPTR
jgi:hypothetical protein